MHLVVLPGNHPSVRTWAERVAACLAPRFSDRRVHEYEHWHTGRERIDFERELRRLPAIEPATVVLGKSAGALLALLAVDRKLALPAGLVLIGLPLAFARAVRIDVDSILGRVPTRALFVQQRHDPGGSFSEVEGLVSRWSQFRAVEVDGDDHRYDDVAELAQVIESWACERAAVEAER